MLKRCNYCTILIIFIVNTSEFAYFFFKTGESQEGRHRLSSLSQTVMVSACRATAYVSSVAFMSVTV